MDFAEYLREIRRLRPAGLQTSLPENLIVLERAASTNLLARALVEEYEREDEATPPVVVLAFEQTGGRGRGGRSWTSPPGRGVYATLAVRVEEPAALATLPLLVGVGLCRALDRWLPGRAELKWPNDLLVGGRKLGGVLIEARVRAGEGGGGEHPATTSQVGFGVNHGQTAAELAELPVLETLPRGATSLLLEGVAGAVSLAELTWALLAGVERELEHLGDSAYALAAYRQRSVHQEGDRLVVHQGDEVVAGTFRGFDEAGRLLLDVAEGGAEGGGERRLRLAAGEVGPAPVGSE